MVYISGHQRTSGTSHREGQGMEKCEHDHSERYAANLQFLWDQYNKLMGLGILASAATMAFLLQGILFNRDLHDTLAVSKISLHPKLLFASILCAGVAAVSFIVSRWCSQVLMERQVYGDFNAALQYFETTLNNETILPTALRETKYMRRYNRARWLYFLGNANEIAKWIGVILIVTSWVLSFCFALPFIDSLSLPRSV